MKATVTALFCVAAAVLLPATSTATTLRLAHNLNQKHPVHKAFEYLNKELQTLSGGKMRVRIFPSGQMGDAVDTLQMLQNGALDMTKGSASDMETFDKSYSVYNLPYIFDSTEHFRTVIRGPVGQAIRDNSRPRGLLAIGTYEAGYRSFYAKKPIRTPADLANMKVRVQSSPTTFEMIRLLGGAPTPIPFGEVYTALEQGVVDAAENNEPSWVDTRHVEVTRYFSEDRHTASPDFLVIATPVWERLKPQEQAWLQEAVERSEVYQSNLWEETVADARKTAKKSGAVFVEVDVDQFRKAVQPLFNKFREDKNMDELLTQLLAEKKRKPNSAKLAEL